MGVFFLSSHYFKWKELKAEMSLCIALCSCIGPTGSFLRLVMNELIAGSCVSVSTEALESLIR